MIIFLLLQVFLVSLTKIDNMCLIVIVIEIE